MALELFLCRCQICFFEKYGPDWNLRSCEGTVRTVCNFRNVLSVPLVVYVPTYVHLISSERNKFLYLISVQHWTCHLKFIHCSLYCSTWHCGSRIFSTEVLLGAFQKFCVWFYCNNKILDKNTIDIPECIHICPLLNVSTSTVHTLFPSTW